MIKTTAGVTSITLTQLVEASLTELKGGMVCSQAL